MVLSRLRLYLLVLAIAFVPQSRAIAAIVEVGDLNIIDDPGNPSDGLRYLDLSISDTPCTPSSCTGLTLAEALAAAQALYPDARLATPSEFDDLVAAAGITYSGPLTASDGFTAGPTTVIATGSAVSALRGALGATFQASATVVWTDPDGSNDAGTTRDRFNLLSGTMQLENSGGVPPDHRIAWLLVSEPVPECPCFDSSGAAPLICYDNHAPSLNAFAYIPTPPTFRQVTNFWCRENALFKWVTAEERDACDGNIHSMCGLNGD